MLVLSRKKGQSIMIHDNIEIVISAIEGDQVKIGIKAPSDIKIYRKELIEAIQQSNQEALSVKLDLGKLKKMMKSAEKS
ncbi:carbon storage regulator CsrA [Paenibacillus ehimensis]|uniref:Translational regulator CsrA n=1 Tax=Paenibacillus ehimensis TaxID=79264 RepID=A0ABT8VCX3_9BACL|nr:carbon storage regulator CsrA [Paenibacillus ehimensis]MDO3678819.1 carbon storage regulator CsrA [Paenibacillus ehimensis]MEC0209434.1 carbon storage regulator CsrA [Paenibacillus ehimensis]